MAREKIASTSTREPSRRSSSKSSATRAPVPRNSGLRSGSSPSARKNSSIAAAALSRASGARATSVVHARLERAFDRFSPCKTRVDLVVVLDPLLAVLPTEEDHLAVDTRVEVHQA